MRTFVASTGNDANAASNCPRTAPCRNFSTAFGVTTAGGEIVALELRSYGDNNIDGNADLDPTPVVIGKK